MWWNSLVAQAAGSSTDEMSAGALLAVLGGWLVIGSIFGLLTAKIAGGKGHDKRLWFLVGLLGGWIGIIVACIIDPKRGYRAPGRRWKRSLPRGRHDGSDGDFGGGRTNGFGDRSARRGRPDASVRQSPPPLPPPLPPR
jgi:hypothetical protein